MSNTKKILVLNSLMIFMMIFSSFVTSIKIETSNQKTSINESQPGSGAGNAATTASVVNECISAFMEAMPPAFCWKKGGDFGVVPTACPNGYFRSLALCFEHCREGFTHIAGICYRNCDGGMTNLGLSCLRWIPFRFYFKQSYIPRSLTNFSSEVACPGDMYRLGALCYRNCELIGMKNCGGGACVNSASSCAMQITNMALKIFEGVATGVSTCLSFGAASAASSAAKASIRSSTRRMSTQMLASSRATITSLRSSTPAVKQSFFAKAKKAMIDNLKGAVETHPYKVYAGNLCEATWNALIRGDKPSEELDTPEKLDNNLFKSLDVLGALKIKESCTDVGSKNKAENCSQAIVESLSTFDPTGLLTIASAFIHPTCDVPTNAPVYTDDSLTKRIQDIARELADLPNCIFVWDDINYLGNRQDICENTRFVGWDFNDRIMSFAAGDQVQGFFFEDSDYQGKFFSFKPSSFVPNLSQFNSQQVNLAGKISSVVIGEPAIVSLYYNNGDFQVNYFLTPLNNFKINFSNCGVNETNTAFISAFSKQLVHCSFLNYHWGTYWKSFWKDTQETNKFVWPGQQLLECKFGGGFTDTS